MRFKRLVAPMLAAGAALALGVALFVTYGLADVVVMVAAVAALAALYLLRHHARATLIYKRRQTPNTAAEVPPAQPTSRARETTPGQVEPTGPHGDAAATGAPEHHSARESAGL